MPGPVEYKLNILEQFQCVGEKCPQNCCRGPWSITLSPEMAARWQAETDKPELAESMEAVETTGNKEYITKKNRSTQQCILLSDEGLCNIQSRYGTEYMPEVCVRFPRFTRTSLHFELKSAWLSCPEIARLALLEQESGGLLCSADATSPIGTSNSMPLDTYSQAVHWLSKVTPAILALRKYRLGIRLYSIAWFCGRIYQCLQRAGGLDQDLVRQLKKYKNQVYETNLRIKQKKLRPDPCNAVNYWKAIASLIRQLKIRHALIELEKSDLWRTLNTEITNAAGYSTLYAKLTKHSEPANTWLQAHCRQILENYLQLVFVNAGFPWDPEGKNHAATFLFCIIPFSIVLLLCWMLYEQAAEITPAQLLTLIYTVEAKATHNNVIYDTLAADPGKYALHQYADVFIDLA